MKLFSLNFHIKNKIMVINMGTIIRSLKIFNLKIIFRTKKIS